MSKIKSIVSKRWFFTLFFHVNVVIITGLQHWLLCCRTTNSILYAPKQSWDDRFVGRAVNDQDDVATAFTLDVFKMSLRKPGNLVRK
ncbi:unnamed protein product [Schistosoma margrebowiei]|uniref:Uncharacterized protein n=1 Tax=Schistosoma margrebowiei TaxID=48269 RepID=A0AA85AQ89_9TREM|nr:unnamed protein product [Schistosoma margrebowiei]